MPMVQLEKNYTVHVYETGPDGRLNLFSLFDYLQDIASDHAVQLGYGRDDLIRNNCFWVLSRIYAVIDELPGWNDSLSIVTWPKGTDRMFALRDYKILDKEKRPVGAATSSWLIVDLESRKIHRPDRQLSSVNSNNDLPDALPRNASKLEPASADGVITPPFRVKLSDLDINLHTNNVRYLRWVLDTYDLGFMMNNVPFSAEINYLAESRLNDEISIRTSEESDTEKTFRHSIVRIPDNTELCRIRIGWKRKTTKS